jgi:5-methyltetrahydropteroyltriglutamate--homocysteine methyltransferase
VAMSRQALPPFRADHVGSLLRPPELKAMRERWHTGRVSASELRAKEDACIREVVGLQEALGLQTVTDGEFRRESFHHDFLLKIEGVEFRTRIGAETESAARSAHRAPFVAYVTRKLARPPVGMEVENFRFLASITRATPKITMPSPTMTHFRGGRAAISREVYPDLAEFFTDLARLYREEIAALGAAGCRYVQLDDTNLAYLCDERMREGVRELGEDPRELPHTYAALINDAIRGRPSGMAVCVHLCRGNSRSQWFASGGYDPIAEVLFNQLEVDGFFLEYDDERSGDFTPLRFVPEGKKVVLGLVTTKRGALEAPDLLKRRIDEASRYVPLDQLCLSPQCGFSSNAAGNLISIDEQRAKLALVVEVARAVWG